MKHWKRPKRTLSANEFEYIFLGFLFGPPILAFGLKCLWDSQLEVGWALVIWSATMLILAGWLLRTARKVTP
jgi:hypothetical protein